MSLFYLAYRYNILFVTDSPIDTKGLIYPRALKQLLTGVYLSELCLIGLFAISGAIGPIILMLIFFLLTILYHQSFNSALNPLIHYLPRSLFVEQESLLVTNSADEPEEKGSPPGLNSEIASYPATNKKLGLLANFFAPHIYSNHAALRKLVPDADLDLTTATEGSTADDAYFPPSISSETPIIWIPRDNIGISSEEVAATGKTIPITDEGATITDDNKIIWDPEASRPPIWRPRTHY